MGTSLNLAVGTGAKGEDTSKSDNDTDMQAHGTAGFIFYQNRDGFHFRSIDSLASKTRVQFTKRPMKRSYLNILQEKLSKQVKIIMQQKLYNTFLKRILMLGSH